MPGETELSGSGLAGVLAHNGNGAEMSLASPAAIAHICRKYHILEMAMFGSAARGDGTSASDIDLCVDFEPGYHPGLGWFDLEEELEALLGRPVDLNRKTLLKPLIRTEALRDAVLLYAA